MHLRLENFDGPLDLLLHLIKTQEMNIFNIPIFTITVQYLAFLRQVPELDFHQAGEYLAMAAQLIEIKANMLIPVLQNKAESPESLAEIPEDDPRKILVEQLLEFEALKRAALMLEQMGALRAEIFPSGEYKRRSDEFDNFSYPIKGNPYELVVAFERVLLKFSQQKENPKISVRAQKITIQQKMLMIKKRLEPVTVFFLSELINDCMSKYELIVTLMAMLELCKSHHIHVEQIEAFAEISILRGDLFTEIISENKAIEC